MHDPLGHPGAPELTRGENWVFRRWFVRAERFVHSRALIDELAPIVGGSERIVVIPHGATPRPEPLTAPAGPTVLMFGRRGQSVEVLVEAMRLVWIDRAERG